MSSSFIAAPYNNRENGRGGKSVEKLWDEDGRNEDGKNENGNY